MLCGLLVEYLTPSDWVWEFSGTNRAAFKIVGLLVYTLVTFFSLVTAGIVSKISPSLINTIFQIVLYNVAPEETFSPHRRVKPCGLPQPQKRCSINDASPLAQ